MTMHRHTVDPIECAAQHAVRMELRGTSVGVKAVRPMLYLWRDQEVPVIFQPLDDYLLHLGRSRRLDGQREIASVVGLFADFVGAHAASAEKGPLWTMFVEALSAGTAGMGRPFAALRWRSRKPLRVARLQWQLNTFLRWWTNDRASVAADAPLAHQQLARALAAWRERPKIPASARPSHRARHATLPHRVVTHDGPDDLQITRRRGGPASHDEAMVVFPEAHIDALLKEGFLRPGLHEGPPERVLHLKDVLITILLHYGGLRMCEPFHLYRDDVRVSPDDPTMAQVRVHHPETGCPPHDRDSRPSRWPDRESYLREVFGMQPRTLATGGRHAGWKHLRLDDTREQSVLVRFFPSEWGRVFLHLFRLYERYQRPAVSNHPYLFVSERRETRGMPYTIQSYRQAHARAVRRIGLIVDKQQGTTPHGHRHACAQRLLGAKVAPAVIQRVLHHRSPSSQEVYTLPTLAAVAAEMRDVEQRWSDAASVQASAAALGMDDPFDTPEQVA